MKQLMMLRVELHRILFPDIESSQAFEYLAGPARLPKENILYLIPRQD